LVSSLSLFSLSSTTIVGILGMAPKKKNKTRNKIIKQKTPQNNHQEDAGMIKRYGNMYNKFIKHCKTSFSSPPFWGEKYLGMLFN
jgi:hypothetical protein